MTKLNQDTHQMFLSYYDVQASERDYASEASELLIKMS